jgi:uncharacterized membrane protein YoaK (UPF0700 family)
VARRDLTVTRDVLLVCLGVTTGATDAVAFERLGRVFASVVTGDLVLLGVSAVRADRAAALAAGTALLGYATGVLLASQRPLRVAPDEDAPWPVQASLALGLDFVLLAGFAVGWEIGGPHPAHVLRIVLLALAAGAMGAQSAAVRRIGPMSTTYLTSTLTGIVESIAMRRWGAAERRGIGIIGMAFAGAAAGIGLVLWAPSLLPVVQLVPLAAVLVASGRLISAARSRAPAGD